MRQHFYSNKHLHQVFKLKVKALAMEPFFPERCIATSQALSDGFFMRVKTVSDFVYAVILALKQTILVTRSETSFVKHLESTNIITSLFSLSFHIRTFSVAGASA
jgi:hypothetical protein